MPSPPPLPTPLPATEFDPASYVDPNGRLFRHEGQLYRGVWAAGAEFYANLIDRPLFRKLMEAGKVVATRRSQAHSDEFPLLLEHDTVEPRTYPVEWAPEMLQAAGLLTLDLALELGQEDLTIQDGTPYNVLFQATRPVFVDVGSICPVEDRYLWVPYQQFCNLFLLPCYLYDARLPAITRPFLYDFLRGVPYEVCSRLLPTLQRWRPQTVSRLTLPLTLDRMIRKLGLEEKLKASAATRPVTRDQRLAFLRGLRRDLAALRLDPGRTEWSDYQEWREFDQPDTWTLKQRHIRDLMERIRPASVVDVACNLGWYSILAARSGSRVVALDQDEGCVSRLYRRVSKEGQNILPLRVDILQPPPAFGWKLKQFASFFQRVKGEMVLALALIHHLCLGQWQSFERVVELFEEFEARTLVLEFVPLEDERSRPMWENKPGDPSWYKLDSLLEVLRKRYARIELLDSFPAGRQLIVAER